MGSPTRRGRGSTSRPPHLQLIRTSRPEGTPEVPPLRHRQSDEEAALKAANVEKMVTAGYVTLDEALPWLDLEVGR